MKATLISKLLPIIISLAYIVSAYFLPKEYKYIWDRLISAWPIFATVAAPFLIAVGANKIAEKKYKVKKK